MITKALIDRFLKNECNEEERKVVIAYLAAHPEELDRLLPEEEFDATVQPGEETPKGEAIYRTIEATLFSKKARIRRLRWAVPAAAAACVIAVALYLMVRPGHRAGVTEKPVVASVGGEWITKKNETKRAMSIELPDSSRVMLEPSAELRYSTRLNVLPERRFYLKGIAFFQVKNSRSRPFTVESDALSTTALGTSFTVNAPVDSAKIIVHLFTGKVAVRASKQMNTPYLLMPGDELVYARESFTATLIRAKREDDIAEVTTSARKTPVSTQPNWYKFGGQPLSQVFEQLSSYYGVSINYRSSDVANRYFTGKFSLSDSIEVILRDIALLHNMDLKKSGGVYILRKNP